MATRLSSKSGTLSGTPVVTSYQTGYTPAVGDLLLLTLNQNKETSGGPTVTTPTGWTLLGSVSGASGAVSFRLSVFGRWATGDSGDNAPSIVVSDTSAQWCLEGWSGLDTSAALPLQPSAGFTGTDGTSATTVSGNALTTSVINEWVFSAFGMRGPGGVTSFAWTGGAAADLAFAGFNTHNYIATGTQTVAVSGTTVTPGATFSSSSGQLEGVVSFGFKPLSGGGPSTGPSAQLLNI